ncbi:MAG: apolipoprotein N-acyltransferase [Acidimicrobiales bacterium]|jgi:apolipoprotein N-acyltransferase
MVADHSDTVVPGRGRVALPALAAGVGLALSLPPWGFWILAFPAAGLLWWRLGGLRPRTRLWAGWLAGLGVYVPGLMWVRSFTLPGAMVLIAIEALFVGLAGLAVPRGPVVARALVFPAAMTLAEAVRQSWPFGGLPIGGVFLGQAGGPLLGVARLGGPLGLTTAVFVGGVGVGALGTAAGRAWRDGKRIRRFQEEAARELPGEPPGDPPPASPLRGAVVGLGTLAATAAVALAGLTAVGVVADHAPDGGPPVGSVTAAAVQGGGARGFRKSQVDPAVVLGAAVAATDELERRTAGHPLDLVLWPEDVVSLGEPLGDSPEQAALSQLAVTLHSTFVVGVTETVSATAFRNEVVAFGPDGTIVDRYEKVHRVPFGEYVPYRSFFAHLGSLSAVPLDAVPGAGSGLLRTPAGPLGAMISYEVFYADRGRSAVRAGAQLLVVPTNTSSYATAQVPTQEIAASEVQAVEQGRDLLQSAPTGYSAWITNRGTLLARSALGVRQIVTATLERRVGLTLYVRWGDTPVEILSLGALVTGLWLAVTRRGRPGTLPNS